MITNESPRIDPGAPRVFASYTRATLIATLIVNRAHAEQVRRGVAPGGRYLLWHSLPPGVRVDMIKAVAQLQREGVIL